MEKHHTQPVTGAAVTKRGIAAQKNPSDVKPGMDRENFLL
jgi:hypothetical protein